MSNTGINAALVACLGELRNVAKNAVNPHFKNRYASLDAILDAARPVLSKHGLALSQEPVFQDGLAGVITRIIHTGGESRESTLLLPLRDQSAQGVGSALTYARRYAVSSVLGIAADDDDDGAQASKPSNEKFAPVKKQAPTKDWNKELAELMTKNEVSNEDVVEWCQKKGSAITSTKDLPPAFAKRLCEVIDDVKAYAMGLAA
jgi:hypothetical protein